MEFVFVDNLPIYIQLVEQIKMFIISGKLLPGERLPSVRELALQIKINPNTIQKALSELELSRLIYTERTNGRFVTCDLELIENIKNDYADELTSKYLANMMKLGYDKESAAEYFRRYGGQN